MATTHQLIKSGTLAKPKGDTPVTSSPAASPSASPNQFGDNVQAVIEGNLLTITIALDVEGTPSASKKSLVLASTRGTREIAGIKFGVNVFKKA